MGARYPEWRGEAGYDNCHGKSDTDSNIPSLNLRSKDAHPESINTLIVDT